MTSSCLLDENWVGKKPGKYRCTKPKTSTCPTGVMGAMRMIVKGTNASMSRAVRRSAITSRGFSDAPTAWH